MKNLLWAQRIKSWPFKLLGTSCSHCIEVVNQQLAGLGSCLSEYFYAVSIKATSAVMMAQIIVGYVVNLLSSKYWYITYLMFTAFTSYMYRTCQFIGDEFPRIMYKT